LKKKIISPAKIWNALQEDKVFSIQPEEVRMVFKPYAFEMIAALEGMLSLEANLINIYKAKLVLVEIWTGSGLIDEIVEAVPLERRAYDTQKAKRVLRQSLDHAVLIGDIICENKDAFLKTYKLTEEAALKIIGLSGPALEKYLKGKLTIGRLLELNPGVLINNG